MAVMGLKDRNKAEVGAMIALLQTCLAPQLNRIDSCLTRIEVRLESIDRHFDDLEVRFSAAAAGLGGEFGTPVGALEKCFDGNGKAYGRRFQVPAQGVRCSVRGGSYRLPSARQFGSA